MRVLFRKINSGIFGNFGNFGYNFSGGGGGAIGKKIQRKISWPPEKCPLGKKIANTRGKNFVTPKKCPLGKMCRKIHRKIFHSP